MDWDFALFEKAKETYSALRKIAWNLVGIAGSISALVWVGIEWLSARAVSLIDWIASAVPSMTLNASSVGVDWSRINQWVPVNETLTFAAIWFALAGMMLLIRLGRKLIPF